MRVALITSRPGHPLLSATTALLSPHHQVEVIDPEASDGPAPYAEVPGGPLADVHLLKARTPRAIALARALEHRGGVVLNSAAATELCQDRTEMAALARRAGLPFARTRTVGALRQLAGTRLARPVVVKSRHSRRGDLVARVDGAEDLRALCAVWAAEPVVVQPFTANDGWDRKVWVIAGQLFAALRRSELAGAERGPAVPLGPDDVPEGWYELARKVGSVFRLDVYGLDLIETADGPLIVDINAFPGARGQAGAPQALAELVLRKGAAVQALAQAQAAQGAAGQAAAGHAAAPPATAP
ncbi:alpha-L-glutamate ligase [Streptomyces oryzae]|uniref:Alpha-L-glutamate ligase n=1 Tax=Streptomyces oryzae TaxID=1434886 RepID=A0ABS3X6K6_9ACTN|nr:alpha-L-glutamate ligase [Streptomyces oryzae]MBO8191014.1 alpha-L-glutamate ligase [Streptomyces oryzae]